MPPDFAYGGTITFDPNTSIERKEKLIGDFPKMLSQHLLFSCDRRYYLRVSKEYHKVDGQDDFEAPHLHFILHTQCILPKYRVRAINEMFKNVYGRSQFYLMTSMKTESYSKYIVKDVERLDEITGQRHYYEMNLEEPLDDYDYEENIAYDFDEI